MIFRLLSKKSLGFLAVTLYVCLHSVPSWETLKTGLNFPHPEAKQYDWQRVAGSKNHFIVYSAYSILDRYPEQEVVVIGVAKTKTKDVAYCRFYFDESDPDDHYSESGHYSENNLKILQEGGNRSRYAEVPGNIETTLEHRNRFYAAIFIKCPLPSWKPKRMSVILSPESVPSNELQIQYKSEPISEPEEEVKYDFQFSVCVNPAYNYNEVVHLIEWIEFYKLMGVEQFTLYNVSFGQAASCILNDLKEGGDPSIKMNIYPWHNVPITKENMIKGRCTKCALSAACNDCLYRHRGRQSEYMIFVDFDEFIMPREHIAQNYFQLIDFLEEQNPTKNISHFSFRNSFFLLPRGDDPELKERCSSLEGDELRYDICQKSYLMSKVYANDRNLPLKRTKYIIKPEGVKESSTHYAIQLESGYQSLNVSDKVAFSRHYRDWPSDFRGLNYGLDRVSKEFGLELVERIARKVEYFGRKCGLGID